MNCVICGAGCGADHHCPPRVLAAVDREIEEEEPEASFVERLEDGFDLMRMAGDFE